VRAGAAGGPGDSTPATSTSRPELSRRGFLAGTTAALAAGGLSSALSGCDSSAVNPGLLSQPLPPAPDNPVTWRIRAGNKPIADGLLAEKDATIRIYARSGRLAASCMDKFSRQHGCAVQLTTFDSTLEAITAMTSRPSRFDVLLGLPIPMLGTLIGRGIIQPLNHSYIPNISQVWSQFTNPFYDQHWQYSAPYTVYTTGIGWRRDLVEADPYAMINAWTLLWQAKYDGKVGILDDYREGITLGLLESEEITINTANPRLIDAAATTLIQLADLVHPRLDNGFSRLATGATWLAHAWSGQVAAAAKNLPPGTPTDVLGYWFPPTGYGPVANDLIAVARSAGNPVLAHLFINFMLDQPNALDNARGTGYLQPLTYMTPTRLVRLGILPPSLISTAVLPDGYYHDLKELQLPVGADALWQQAWQSVVAHMQLTHPQ
jgi:spermidine/putrescine transport system substrate-binding protein